MKVVGSGCVEEVSAECEDVEKTDERRVWGKKEEGNYIIDGLARKKASLIRRPYARAGMGVH